MSDPLDITLGPSRAANTTVTPKQKRANFYERNAISIFRLKTIYITLLLSEELSPSLTFLVPIPDPCSC